MTDDNAIADAATALRDAYGGSFITPLRERLGTNDPVTAYAIQEHNTKHWIAEGRRLIGRKIGATSAAVQNMLGLDQPDYGMLFADMSYSDGEIIPVDKVQQPKVEGEVAFAIGQDLDSDQLTIADILASIDYAVAAIEIVGSRIENWNIKILDTIADNASAGLFVLWFAATQTCGLRSCAMWDGHREGWRTNIHRRGHGLSGQPANGDVVACQKDGGGRAAAQEGRPRYVRRTWSSRCNQRWGQYRAAYIGSGKRASPFLNGRS